MCPRAVRQSSDATVVAAVVVCLAGYLATPWAWREGWGFVRAVPMVAAGLVAVLLIVLANWLLDREG